MPDGTFNQLVLSVWQTGGEGGGGKYLKWCDVGGIDDDYSFDLYL